MQKKIIVTVVINLLWLSLFAQNKIVDSLIDWTIAHPTVDSEYIITVHRISYRLSEKDIKRSFAYYEKVVTLSDSLNFTYGKSLAQINLGILLGNSANFEASNNAYFKAINYAEACGALRLQAVSLNNIGDNLKTLRDFDRCREYTRSAIKINIILQAWRGVAINYELLQQCDLEEKLYDKAKINLLLGMPFALKANDSYILSQFYLGFGKLQAIDNNKDSAAYYFTKAMEQSRLQSDLRNELQIYLAQVQYFPAIPAAKKIIVIRSCS